jgi:hypothetical protein
MDAESFDALRLEIYDRAVSVAEEWQVEALLEEIVRRAEDDLASEFGPPEALPADRAEELLVDVETWAALASHVTLEAYAGPVRELGAMHLSRAGWARGVGAQLTKLARLLTGYLIAARNAIGAVGFSIGVGFPAGVSVALNW